jgi:uncharacterized RDD family membrane protein YckC
LIVRNRWLIIGILGGDFPLEEESNMSQVAEVGVKPQTIDPYEIGWYIESADEEIYGPVSRKTLRRFLEEKTITPNTLVRHCTQPEAKPAADQPAIMERFSLDTKALAVGDRLADVWPRKKRDQQALAEDSLPCARHKRPAVLVCVRCHATYCTRCRAKPLRKQFFLCRRCQVGMHNRRFGALIVDNLLLLYVPRLAALAGLSVVGVSQAQIPLIVNVVQVGSFGLLFVRDSLFRGAGIGKRIAGLRVVQTTDGKTPLTYGQGVVRWLSQFIPIFNLADAIAPYYDPLLRRYGDRWAGTRVLDTETKLAKDRQKIAKRLITKGVRPATELEMTMEKLARLA